MGITASRDCRTIRRGPDSTTLIETTDDKERVEETQCCPFMKMKTTKTRARRAQERRRINILLIGAPGTGKSQLARIIEHGTVYHPIPSFADSSSINMHAVLRRVRRLRKDSNGRTHQSRKKRTYTLCIWDVPGDSARRGESVVHAKSADVIVFVYDPCVPSSGLEAASGWVDGLIVQSTLNGYQDHSSGLQVGDESDTSKPGSDAGNVAPASNKMSKHPLVVFFRNDSMRLARDDRKPTPRNKEDECVLGVAQRLNTKRVASISLLPFVNALNADAFPRDQEDANLVVRQVNRLLDVLCQDAHRARRHERPAQQ